MKRRNQPATPRPLTYAVSSVGRHAQTMVGLIDGHWTAWCPEPTCGWSEQFGDDFDAAAEGRARHIKAADRL